MRIPNPHRPELVAAVFARVKAGELVADACQAVLSDPPSILYPSLTPSVRTLKGWFYADHPEYRDIRVTQALTLLAQGQTQTQVATHFGVTTRTIRNWLCRVSTMNHHSRPRS